MMNGNGARYVGDGDFALKNQTPEMKAVFAGTERTTNKNEGLYGNLKYYSGMFGTISAFNAASVACAQRNHLFGDISGQYVRSKNPEERVVITGMIDQLDEPTRRAYAKQAAGVEK